MSRPHSQRLLANLADIRNELESTVTPIPDTEMDWAPGEGMKSYRALLREIGAMEKLCAHWLATGELLEWDMEQYVPAESARAALEQLGRIRTQTTAYLNDAGDSKLQASIAVPEPWQQYMGKEIEPEEVVRWIGQHEYYHLGQIISYRWIQGHSPE